MIIDHYGTLSRFLLEKATAINFNLQGPAEIEYGFGWEPTVSFWFEDRRVHFYFDFDGKMTVEVSEVQPGLKIKRGEVETDSLVRRAVISTTEEAWDIVDCFLRQHCDFENLPKHDWIIDTLDHDKFIPHPPSAPNAGNIASLVTVMQQVGEPWHPQLQKNNRGYNAYAIGLEDPEKTPNTACTRLVGVCSFSGRLCGLKLVPSKRRYLVPPTSG